MSSIFCGLSCFTMKNLMFYRGDINNLKLTYLNILASDNFLEIIFSRFFQQVSDYLVSHCRKLPF